MLAKERPYGDWIVYNCLNCGCDTHALHAIKGVDRVLLPTTMEVSLGKISSVYWLSGPLASMTHNIKVTRFNQGLMQYCGIVEISIIFKPY